jgi:hypothetical protein
MQLREPRYTDVQRVKIEVLATASPDEVVVNCVDEKATLRSENAF